MYKYLLRENKPSILNGTSWCVKIHAQEQNVGQDMLQNEMTLQLTVT